MPKLTRFVARLALGLLAATPRLVAAQDVHDSAVFDFYVGGLRAGLMTFDGVQSGTRYSVTGSFSTAGLVALFRTMHYDATVTGSILNGVLRPDRYVLISNPGHGQHLQTIVYSNGTPQAPVQDPPRDRAPLALDPTTQGGTVDTLTAVYQTMRAMPAAQACAATIALYDGTTRASFALGPADGPVGTLACNGEYRRVAGYSAKDMQEPVFPFRITYAPTPDGQVQVTRIDMESIFGKASLQRR